MTIVLASVGVAWSRSTLARPPGCAQLASVRGRAVAPSIGESFNMRSRTFNTRSRMLASGALWRHSSGLALTVALVACGAPAEQSEWNDESMESNADLSSSAALLVELSPLEGASGELEYRLTNTSADRVSFFAWDTAANGGLARNLFDVRLDGEAADFTGPHVYLATPDPEAFTELEPGATLTTVIRLPSYYDMNRPGTYSVRALAVAPTILRADQTSSLGAVTVPSSDVAVAVDDSHVHQAPAADSVPKASAICISDCQLDCALAIPGGDPTFCVDQCLSLICEGKFSNCSFGDRERLQDGEDEAAARIQRSLPGVSSGADFTNVFGARNDGKIALVSSILNKMTNDLPTVPYNCNTAGAVVGASGTPGVDFVCAPRSNFSQIVVGAVTTQQPNARVEVCPEMLASIEVTAGLMVHESSHHFGTNDSDPNPLNDPEAYRRYVMAFP
jgi:hypothetical protein